MLPVLFDFKRIYGSLPDERDVPRSFIVAAAHEQINDLRKAAVR
jgi:hypothetical protein